MMYERRARWMRINSSGLLRVSWNRSPEEAREEEQKLKLLKLLYR